MTADVNIGENRRYELEDALLVYRCGGGYSSSNRGDYITLHNVISGPGTPTLGPAKALTTAFIDDLCRNIGKAIDIEVLPENIVACNRDRLVWWIPAKTAPMFFKEGDNPDLKGLSGARFPQPALVFMVDNHELSIRALKASERPRANAKLSIAPYWNVNEEGSVCLGTARRPAKFSVSTIPHWERCFWESEFTHPSGVHRLTMHQGGFTALWRSLKGKKTFPADTLVDSGETLGNWIRK
jgi:PRTRC genetic system protein B